MEHVQTYLLYSENGVVNLGYIVAHNRKYIFAVLIVPDRVSFTYHDPVNTVILVRLDDSLFDTLARGE